MSSVEEASDLGGAPGSSVRLATAWQRLGIGRATAAQDRSGREELDRLGGRHRRDVAAREPEHLDPRGEFALELGVAELARDDPAIRDLTGWRNRDLEHDFSLQRRLVAKCARVDRVDRRLVAVEHE